MKKRSILRTLLCAVVAVGLVFAFTPDAQADPKPGKGKKGFGKASVSHTVSIVVNPAGLTTNDPALAITQDDPDGVLDAVKVRSTETGTDHWVHLPVNLAASTSSGKGKTHPMFVVGVEICHQETSETTPPPLSFIDTLRLSKLESPLGSEIEHEDETDLLSEVPTCVQSPVAFPFPIEGAVTLSLNLSFDDIDDVFCFGVMRIILANNPNNALSEPSMPSDPSDPSAPSGPSEPSTPSSPSLPSLPPPLP